MSLDRTAEAMSNLETLASGLIFVSESDHPLAVTRMGVHAGPEPSWLLDAIGKPADSPVEIVKVEELFGPALRDQPFHSESDRAVVGRYRELVRYLTTHLGGTTVFRVGTIKIDVYALGQTSEGEWVGVATTVVET